MSKEAMKLALEHIEGNYTVSAKAAIKALEEALAKQEQGEPVAWYDPTNHHVSTDKHDPLFTPLGQLWPLFTQEKNT
jgi:hypothetical protein